MMDGFSSSPGMRGGPSVRNRSSRAAGREGVPFSRFRETSAGYLTLDDLTDVTCTKLQCNVHDVQTKSIQYVPVQQCLINE